MKRSPGQYFAKISPRRLVIFIVAGVLAIISFAALVYWAGRKIELGFKKQEEVRGDLTGRFQEPRTIYFRGTPYMYRDGLLTVLLMGIDKAEQSGEELANYRNGGQADFLLLLVFDSQTKTVTPIHIDRDTMAEITILGVLGNEAGTRKAQICLSHGFGDGREQSSQYTVDAVSKLLFGVDINFYIAVNLDAISAINDALGGVSVTLNDDFTSLDPAMKLGSTITLMGDQAEYYVRSRMGIGIGTNEARMDRQRTYLSGAGIQLEEKLQMDNSFIGNLFDQLEDSLQTNMKRGRMINEFYESKDYRKKDIITPAGNYTVGKDGFMEFQANVSSLEEMVLNIFFVPQEASEKEYH